MPQEPSIGVSDEVFAELVESAPIPVTPTQITLPVAPDATPTQQAAQATIEQTGADPPPRGDR